MPPPTWCVSICDRLFGARADRLFAGSEPVVTSWGEDRLFGGAYAYAVPGHAGARRQLAEPVGDGRLCSRARQRIRRSRARLAGRT